MESTTYKSMVLPLAQRQQFPLPQSLRLCFQTQLYTGKGTRFNEKSILDVKTHFKQTETFQYTHFTSPHPPSVKKGFFKGEDLRILRTNSSETMFEENISNFKKHLLTRGYLHTLIENLLSEIKFTQRDSALLKKTTRRKKKYCFL